MLTGPQVWYVAKVYPERVGAEEAEAEPRWRNLNDDDQDYWRAAANVLNDLSSQN